MVEQHARKLQVDPFASRRSRNENAWTVRTFESPLSSYFCPVVAPFENIDAGVGEGVVNGGLQSIHAT